MIGDKKEAVRRKDYGLSTRLEQVNIIADQMLAWIREDEERVWIKDFFATVLVVPMENVVERWAHKSPKFRNNLMLVRDIVEGRLLRMSLDKKNKAPAGAIFALKNQFEWMDKQDVKKNQKPRDYKLDRNKIAEKAKKFFPKPSKQG